VRRLWTGLRPTILDELGLEPAIDWLLQENCGLNGIPWTLTPPDRPLSLDSQTRVSLFRFCQECVSLPLPPAQSIGVCLQRTQHQLDIGLNRFAVGDQRQVTEILSNVALDVRHAHEIEKLSP
jgi:signal transduction histidine kinase